MNKIIFSSPFLLRVFRILGGKGGWTEVITRGNGNKRNGVTCIQARRARMQRTALQSRGVTRVTTPSSVIYVHNQIKSLQFITCMYIY